MSRFLALMLAVSGFCLGVAFAAEDSAKAGLRPSSAGQADRSVPSRASLTPVTPNTPPNTPPNNPPDTRPPKKPRAAKPKRIIPHYRVASVEAAEWPCRSDAQGSVDCLRGHLGVTGVQHGFPGTPAYLMNLARWESVGWESPYQMSGLVAGAGMSQGQGAAFSPYGLGGLRLPDSLGWVGPEFAPEVLAEVWAPKAPLDTPMTRLRWQRGAMAFNQFQVDLERALVGGSYVGLSYASTTADSQFFDYSFNVHQPYLSGWGFLGKLYGPIDRDSASLVLSGQAPGIEANHMRPRLGFWIDTNQVVELFYDRVRNRTQLGLPRGVDRRDSVMALFGSSLGSDGLGVLWSKSWGRLGEASQKPTLSVGYLHASADRELQTGLSPAGDSVANSGGGVAASRLTSESDRLDIGSAWALAGLRLTSALRSESERYGGEPGLGWRDAQSLRIEAARFQDDSVKPGFTYALGAGLRRESRATNRVVYLPEAFGEAAWSLPWGFGLSAGVEARRRDPDPLLLVRDEAVLNRLASPQLDPRSEWGGQGVLSWGQGRFSVYGGAEGFQIRHPWAPRLLPSRKACQELSEGVYLDLTASACQGLATVADTLALAYRNYASQERLQALAGLRYGLGHWDLWIENRFRVRDRLKDPDYLESEAELASVPARVFRGQVLWTRRLISDRMGLRVEWNWEWLSHREVWAAQLDGTARAVKLDEYLTLDFHAAMQIKTFTLHFRAMNMNHDRYAPDPGVHPAGVNFRFGIDWALFN